jgi:hypothetical protein
MGAKEMKIVSIDPGVRGCGVAMFDEAGLCWARYLSNRAKTGDDYFAANFMASEVFYAVVDEEPKFAIIECPMVYRGAQQKGAQSDIIAVAGVSYATAARLAPVGVSCQRVFPYQWKGQVPKEIMLKRIESTLKAQELARIEKTPKSLRHNVIDAVGIGLHYFGRL